MSYKNGYKPSLFDTEDGRCFLCKYFEEDPPIDTARHEVIHGVGNRELAKHYGLWICVCPRHHEDIHANPKEYYWLKEAAQALFEENFPDKDFLAIFGRKYI